MHGEVVRAVKESKRSRRSRFLRDAMVDVQIAGRGIRSRRVLLAMRQVPREIFLDRRFADAAYEDSAVPIPKGQTISQPYIVARMLEAAAIAKSDRVLEIGAGSGYLAALAAKLGREVCALERHEALVQRARSRLRHLGCRNVDLRQGDGTAGWPDGGEFDVIVVSAAGAQIPAALKAQLAPSGRLLIPLGDPDDVQWLTKLTRGPEGRFVEDRIEEVRFVPLVSCGEPRKP
ncbi:protein-L-isoaspartate(D-aspartate) O-methyltransferase [Bradyrhizobium japonicum]